jgi:trk system potassium uptake protein TrkH
MNLPVVQRLVGFLLMLFSVAMLPPMLVALIYADSSILPFLYTMFVTLTVGAAIWFPQRHNRSDLGLRDGFMIVVLFWTVLSAAGALPFLFADQPNLSVASAFFESMSGLTTTGATVITNLDSLPRAVLFYRQELQWFGGLGIIVLAVAILPMLGIGGMQLYKAETPGPIKDSKMTPRITETAKALWYIYLALTAACALAYYVAGMNAFDAICHAFSTIAIGGFSTHDASLGYFDSNAINLVASLFMLVAGANFALHFVAWRKFSLRHYLRDAEFRFYLVILVCGVVVTASGLWFVRHYTSVDSFLNAIFHVISFTTTTGFTTADYGSWPIMLSTMLIIGSFIGGCAGSTAGGMKVIRILLLFKQGGREVKRLVHPSAQIAVKIGGTVVPQRVIDSVWGFFAAYIGIFVVLLLVVMATGLDQVSAFSAVAACMNNLGPGLGEVLANFASVNDYAKWLLAGAMLLGRLEIFTLLVLFTPAFWRI